jgi:hypothetical protein
MSTINKRRKMLASWRVSSSLKQRSCRYTYDAGWVNQDVLAGLIPQFERQLLPIYIRWLQTLMVFMTWLIVSLFLMPINNILAVVLSFISCADHQRTKDALQFPLQVQNHGHLQQWPVPSSARPRAKAWHMASSSEVCSSQGEQ